MIHKLYRKIFIKYHCNDSQNIDEFYHQILGLDYRKLGNFAVHHQVLGSDIKT
jgi:hypothetical protein